MHKKNDDGVYVYDISDLTMSESVKPITCIVNKTAELIENKSIFGLTLSLSDEFKNIMLIYLKTQNSDYILSINNYDMMIETNFFKKLQDTMQIILKRAESYEKNIKAISTDLLTGVDNRNSYEMRLHDLDESDNNLIFGLFDLFRLKYINDNYSHAFGDNYIQEFAKILVKYWPKQRIEIINNEEKLVDTGHCIYRVGGDEFVLITNREQLELAKIKASLAAEEVMMIDLGIKDESPIGLNYGILLHTPGDFIKNTYQEADKMMSDDKKKMYLKYGLERRKI